MNNVVSAVTTVLQETGWKLDKIYHHDQMMVKGWMFIIEYEGKHFLALNTWELKRAVDGPIKNLVDIAPNIFDVPMSDDRGGLATIIRGEFVWTKRIEYGGTSS